MIFYRLVLTTILIVHKYFSDYFYSNLHIATAGGVDLKNINYLESMFLQYIDFNLSISREEYIEYENALESYFLLMPLKHNMNKEKKLPTF